MAGMIRHLKISLRILPGIALLGNAAVTLAQDEAVEAAGDLDPAGPGGITTLIFLLGVTGILVAGGIHIARDSFRQDDDS
ncbi:MAG: hypothetical protein OXB89_09220 [Anaerolineaceae bacterium]|nr:hypothetical protein [Anaerolineaceae bacterium]